MQEKNLVYDVQDLLPLTICKQVFRSTLFTYLFRRTFFMKVTGCGALSTHGSIAFWELLAPSSRISHSLRAKATADNCFRALSLQENANAPSFLPPILLMGEPKDEQPLRRCGELLSPTCNNCRVWYEYLLDCDHFLSSRPRPQLFCRRSLTPFFFMKGN